MPRSPLPRQLVLTSLWSSCWFEVQRARRLQMPRLLSPCATRPYVSDGLFAHVEVSPYLGGSLSQSLSFKDRDDFLLREPCSVFACDEAVNWIGFGRHRLPLFSIRRIYRLVTQDFCENESVCKLCLQKLGAGRS